MKKSNDYPDSCPVTGRPFFMEIEDESGNIVPTYGGVYDSYTIPVRGYDDGDVTYYCQRFCHDSGGWMGDEDVDESLILVSQT